MDTGTRLAVRTASTENSIWRDLPEAEFRQHLINLERRTNAVPMDSETFASHCADEGENVRSWLTSHSEQQLADDIAYIASVREGAQSVAAVCIIRQQKPYPVLRLRFAAADTISKPVTDMMSSIFALLGETNSIEPTENFAIAERILSAILDQHKSKILGRLRSRAWKKPQYLKESHKKPLWEDFANVLHRVQHVYPAKRQEAHRRSVRSHLEVLASLYEQFERIADTELEDGLRDLVKATYEFCHQSSVRRFAADLARLRATNQIAAALKCLHQLEKVAAYWRIANDLVKSAREFPSLFHHVDLECLPPYEAVPTNSAYESWAKTCHVHAEVQLLVAWDLDQADLKRNGAGAITSEIRVIGTSKYLCYLCYLFMKFHGTCSPTNTHGRLYDQWTVPDLAAFSPVTRHKYRYILAKIDAVISTQAAQEPYWRPEPMTSRQNLLFEPHLSISVG